MARANSGFGGRRTVNKPFSSAAFSSKAIGAAPSSKSKNKGDRPTSDDTHKPARIPKDKDAIEDDIYTFEQGSSRRMRTDSNRFNLSREERSLAGGRASKSANPDASASDVSDDDSDDEMASRIRAAALKIAGQESFDLEEDEEEVNSDDAWDEEGDDEERWGDAFEKWKGGKSQGKKKVSVKAKGKAKEIVEQPLNIDLEESDDDLTANQSSFRPDLSAFGAAAHGGDSDSDDEDDDQNDDEEMDGNNSALIGSDADEEENSEEDEEEDDEIGDNDEEMPEPSLPSDSEDEEEPSRIADDDLLSFVQSLPTGEKRKAEIDHQEDQETENKKRRVLQSRRGPGGRDDAGEFGSSSAKKLSLADILSTQPSLKSSASALLSGPSPSTSALRQGTLAAPLPTVVTERLAREAAYEATKAEGDKWGGVMKRIKEAEHLQFPLQGPKGAKERQRGGVKSAGDLVGGFQPTNDLESAVTALLNSANLNSTQISQAEEDALQAQDLSVEEITARRAALRYQRELLFRAESRSKRVAKIKSKTFRKLARKRAEKDQVDLEDLQRLDPEKAEEEALKLEALRAKERATLKHSAKSGRWAKDQHGAGETADKRLEMEDMLRKKEQLSRKIQGRGSDSESDAESDDEDEAPIESAFDQLADLQRREAELTEEAAGKTKGLMGMKFMQRAMAREKAKVDDEERELRQQLENYEDGREASEDEENDEEVVRVQNNPGRLVFGRTLPTSISTVVPNDPSVTASSQTLGSPQDEIPRPQPPARSAAPPISSAQDSGSNPWLTQPASSARARKNNTVVAGRDADAAAKSVTKQKKAKSNSAKQSAADDAEVDIDLDASVLAVKKKLPLENGYEGEDDEDEEMVRKGPKAFKQRDLVAQAFAGDNVVEDFAAEKQRAIEADAPKTEDTTLPGWGSWAGKGVKSRKPNPKYLKVTPGIVPSQRKDFARSNVIISEKKDKKAAKYLATDLPYPYTSAAQYEASFKDPMGADWNTRATHQRETMPRVIKKPGAIIAPVSRMF